MLPSDALKRAKAAAVAQEPEPAPAPIPEIPDDAIVDKEGVLRDSNVEEVLIGRAHV